MANLRISFILPLLFFIASSASAQNAIKVPQGKPSLVDGKCRAEEWKDAAELIISDNYKAVTDLEAELSQQAGGQWLIRRMGTQSTPPR